MTSIILMGSKRREGKGLLYLGWILGSRGVHGSKRSSGRSLGLGLFGATIDLRGTRGVGED